MIIKTKITNHVLLCALLLSPVINAAQEPILPTTPEQWRLHSRHKRVGRRFMLRQLHVLVLCYKMVMLVRFQA